MFVRGVADRLELDGGVLDVEVPGQALLQLVQQPGQVPVAETGVIDHHVRGEHRQVRGHRAGVQVVHGVHVRHAEYVGTHVGQVDALGVASISTSTVSRSSFQVRGICPIVSQELIDAYRDLGASAPHVVFLAVNVNRYHLQVADVAAFSGEQRLTTVPAWHFLTGSYPSLRAVWQAYQIEVDAPGPDADVIHSSQMYFIDPQGRERFLANPMVDHSASGSSYLPADQLASWGQGIALVARHLAA